MSLSSDKRQGERLTVRVDPVLRSLIPDFLDRRRDDVQVIASALEAGDFAAIQSLAHRMKGSGGSLGFAAISDIGADLEAAAIGRDGSVIGARAGHLLDYLDRVDVVYE